MFKLLPDAKITWSDVWVGALGTFLSGLLMLLAKPVAQLEH